MSNSTLPRRASLEYLRKLAKDRLAIRRKADPHAQLATALLSVAQDHGFSSWRALKAEFDRLHDDSTSRWFDAVERGDVTTVRDLLREDPALIAARRSRHDVTALHVAAGCGDVEVARVLLDAGADPNDVGDDSGLGVIGWATRIGVPGEIRPDVVSLLVERGGRHHIFSAIALGDLETIRSLVEHDPDSLDQRLSKRYHGETALHFAIARQRDDILQLLIELGADLEASDHNGQTALEFALLRGARAAGDRLRAAGARPPTEPPVREMRRDTDLATSIQSATIVIGSRDVAATLNWYASIGFTEVARHPKEGATVFWGMVTFGTAVLTFDIREKGDPRGVSVLFVTDRVSELFELLKTRQLATADVEFVETLREPEHGGLEFSIRDPNGFTLRFLQERT
jgi:hypothetical protein